jgi:Nif-specific regulatory protein
MGVETTAYLVVRRDDGFGDVFPLQAGRSYTLGRAPSSTIVLKDDQCSREHAEVLSSDGRWRVRDLNSLNGTRVNGERLDAEWELSPRDEVHLGRTRLLFVEDMNQLPDLPRRPPEPDSRNARRQRAR